MVNRIMTAKGYAFSYTTCDEHSHFQCDRCKRDESNGKRDPFAGLSFSDRSNILQTMTKRGHIATLDTTPSAH
jgi:hypothetical protein